MAELEEMEMQVRARTHTRTHARTQVHTQAGTHTNKTQGRGCLCGLYRGVWGAFIARARARALPHTHAQGRGAAVRPVRGGGGGDRDHGHGPLLAPGVPHLLPLQGPPPGVCV